MYCIIFKPSNGVITCTSNYFKIIKKSLARVDIFVFNKPSWLEVTNIYRSLGYMVVICKWKISPQYMVTMYNRSLFRSYQWFYFCPWLPVSVILKTQPYIWKVVEDICLMTCILGLHQNFFLSKFLLLKLITLYL